MTTSSADLARRPLTDSSSHPPPATAVVLPPELQAPPRLVADLRSVHDVACELADWVRQHHPDVAFDRHAVVFGAAVHAIGKVLCTGELSGPGSLPENAGYELLPAYGVPPGLARFARTHASWTADGIGIGDPLVSLADKVWKAKRVDELEQLVTARPAAASGQEPWEVFLTLDDELDRVAAGADDRLAFQSSHPVAV